MLLELDTIGTPSTCALFKQAQSSRDEISFNRSNFRITRLKLKRL